MKKDFDRIAVMSFTGPDDCTSAAIMYDSDKIGLYDVEKAYLEMETKITDCVSNSIDPTAISEFFENWDDALFSEKVVAVLGELEERLPIKVVDVGSWDVDTNFE